MMKKVGASRSALVLAAAAVLAASAVSVAGEPFRATSRHGFDDVERWKQAFDDPKRDEWQKPEAVVDALGLRRGMIVADLGAGTGYFSRYLSKAVGAEGTVFAVDVEPNLVALLRERSEKEVTKNVVPVLASFDNPRLPAGGVDVVFVVDTFHHIDWRLEYFRSLRRALRPEGRVAVIEWRKEKIPVGPPDPEHKLARDRVVDEMKAAGYELAGEPAVLPYQYFLIFRVRPL
ncbi:MAG: methyltransferase domain-containing protein [Candidatus Binatia bacterium]